MFEDKYSLKTKEVRKIGKSFYKDGNKLGRRKTGLALFEKAGREVRKYNMQYPDMDMK
ncbi:hypothetical protein AMYT_a0184 (plasmid) [Malaciobacter mytili LMG 24559]|uniref:hypothetical protein n=1 Tax=Malaciobacter mytili TaxID=603050 RepID=UPI000E101296|nr:hypothetical protein [Malaciobacter mytili]AXH16482.1 hypothetical protein AMYT_a0184 [Malaciobacter mytili LMG 24559]